MKKLILCDSGLGGLDIAAPFFRKKETAEWEMIYINGWPDPKFGYNDLADSAMQEISWKQFFLIICINLCKDPPTIGELSEIVGSSHQNVKQLLLKLEKKDFIAFQPDEKDKRKQRIRLTEHCREFCEKNDEMSISIMNNMFEGIPEKDLKTTIRTIMQIEKNLRGQIG